MINVNVIYILILAIRIYDVNPLVGICIGCEYAYKSTRILLFLNHNTKFAQQYFLKKNANFIYKKRVLKQLDDP